MIIHHISDLHGDWTHLTPREGDLLVVSGDLCQTGSEAEIDAALAWVAEWPVTHRVFVPGNHDLAVQTRTGDYRERCRAWGIALLADEAVTVNDWVVYGTPWVWDRPQWGWPPRDRAFTRSAQEGQVGAGILIPEGIDLLISHGPALGLGDQHYPGSYWHGLGANRLGDPGLRVALERPHPPVLHCFGHVHHNPGVQKYRETWCSNAARSQAVFHFNERTLARVEWFPGT